MDSDATLRLILIAFGSGVLSAVLHRLSGSDTRARAEWREERPQRLYFLGRDLGRWWAGRKGIARRPRVRKLTQAVDADVKQR